MRSKIFRSTLFVAAIVLLCCVVIIMGVLYNYFDGVQVRQLKDELNLAAIGTQHDGISFLKSVGSDRHRLTWVAADGTVIYDTEADESSMENHADREEIQAAFLTGTGSARRYSDTLTQRTLYEAKRLEDGSVLRISIHQATSAALIGELFLPIIGVVLISIALTAFLSKRMAKRITVPLNQLDLEHPLQNEAYEEITPLLERLNQLNLQVSSQIQKLQRRADEFEQITQNMSEGLMLLDKEERILSINPTAQQLFGVDESCIGKSFLAVDHATEIRNAVSDAFLSGQAQLHVSRNGREYQFAVNRIISDGNVIGAVLLAFDITEQYNAERKRREFSANVSHELKTPLQSIIGAAELLENGVVKSEDAPRFLGYIHKEAARLVNLIEDIIRLSQLDEGTQLPMEEVELFSLAQETIASLHAGASSKGISLTLTGEMTTVSGVRRLLSEIIYNLCDNAVKYTNPGGSVMICVKDKTLTVSDTGIGIPQEHQERIFERFYRVDKSHSKQSGGTGLGLSIVKHAVSYHKATLELQSVPSEGTTITVRF